MDRKRRTNPYFLSDGEVARDRIRLQHLVKGITSNCTNFNANFNDKASSHYKETNQNSTVEFTNINLNKPARRPIVRSRTVCSNIEVKPNNYQINRYKNYPKLENVKYIKIIGKTQNFTIQFNFETLFIEILTEDALFGEVFKLVFNSTEAKLLINLLTIAKNSLSSKCNECVGEIPRFAVDVDSSQKLVTLYLKDTKSTKFGFTEEEITPLIDNLREATELSLKT